MSNYLLNFDFPTSIEDLYTFEQVRFLERFAKSITGVKVVSQREYTSNRSSDTFIHVESDGNVKIGERGPTLTKGAGVENSLLVMFNISALKEYLEVVDLPTPNTRTKRLKLKCGLKGYSLWSKFPNASNELYKTGSLKEFVVDSFIETKDDVMQLFLHLGVYLGWYEIETCLPKAREFGEHVYQFITGKPFDYFKTSIDGELWKQLQKDPQNGNPNQTVSFHFSGNPNNGTAFSMFKLELKMKQSNIDDNQASQFASRYMLTPESYQRQPGLKRTFENPNLTGNDFRNIAGCTYALPILKYDSTSSGLNERDLVRLQNPNIDIEEQGKVFLWTGELRSLEISSPFKIIEIESSESIGGVLIHYTDYIEKYPGTKPLGEDLSFFIGGHEFLISMGDTFFVPYKCFGQIIEVNLEKAWSPSNHNAYTKDANVCERSTDYRFVLDYLWASNESSNGDRFRVPKQHQEKFDNFKFPTLKQNPERSTTNNHPAYGELDWGVYTVAWAMVQEKDPLTVFRYTRPSPQRMLFNHRDRVLSSMTSISVMYQNVFSYLTGQWYVLSIADHARLSEYSTKKELSKFLANRQRVATPAFQNTGYYNVTGEWVYGLKTQPNNYLNLFEVKNRSWVSNPSYVPPDVPLVVISVKDRLLYTSGISSILRKNNMLSPQLKIECSKDGTIGGRDYLGDSTNFTHPVLVSYKNEDILKSVYIDEEEWGLDLSRFDPEKTTLYTFKVAELQAKYFNNWKVPHWLLYPFAGYQTGVVDEFYQRKRFTRSKDVPFPKLSFTKQNTTMYTPAFESTFSEGGTVAEVINMKTISRDFPLNEFDQYKFPGQKRGLSEVISLFNTEHEYSNSLTEWRGDASVEIANGCLSFGDHHMLRTKLSLRSPLTFLGKKDKELTESLKLNYWSLHESNHDVVTWRNRDIDQRSHLFTNSNVSSSRDRFNKKSSCPPLTYVPRDVRGLFRYAQHLFINDPFAAPEHVPVSFKRITEDHTWLPIPLNGASLFMIDPPSATKPFKFCLYSNNLFLPLDVILVQYEFSKFNLLIEEARKIGSRIFLPEETIPRRRLAIFEFDPVKVELSEFLVRSSSLDQDKSMLRGEIIEPGDMYPQALRDIDDAVRTCFSNGLVLALRNQKLMQPDLDWFRKNDLYLYPGIQTTLQDNQAEKIDGYSNTKPLPFQEIGNAESRQLDLRSEKTFNAGITYFPMTVSTLGYPVTGAFYVYNFRIPVSYLFNPLIVVVDFYISLGTRLVINVNDPQIPSWMKSATGFSFQLTGSPTGRFTIRYRKPGNTAEMGIHIPVGKKIYASRNLYELEKQIVEDMGIPDIFLWSNDSKRGLDREKEKQHRMEGLNYEVLTGNSFISSFTRNVTIYNDQTLFYEYPDDVEDAEVNYTVNNSLEQANLDVFGTTPINIKDMKLFENDKHVSFVVGSSNVEKTGVFRYENGIPVGFKKEPKHVINLPLQLNPSVRSTMSTEPVTNTLNKRVNTSEVKETITLLSQPRLQFKDSTVKVIIEDDWEMFMRKVKLNPRGKKEGAILSHMNMSYSDIYNNSEVRFGHHLFEVIAEGSDVHVVIDIKNMVIDIETFPSTVYDLLMDIIQVSIKPTLKRISNVFVEFVKPITFILTNPGNEVRKYILNMVNTAVNGYSINGVKGNVEVVFNMVKIDLRGMDNVTRDENAVNYLAEVKDSGLTAHVWYKRLVWLSKPHASFKHQVVKGLISHPQIVN